MKKFILTAVMLMAFALGISFAQCALIPVDLSTRTESSDLIIEAEISKQLCFRSEPDDHIYTANYLTVSKLFKGLIQDREVVLISPGGYLEGEAEEVIPSIQLSKNVRGIFFLYNSDITGDENLKNYKPFSGPQACIYYDENSESAYDVFNTYPSIESIYSQIEAMTGNVRTELLKINLEKPTQSKSATVIDKIHPQTSAAGIKAELSLIGSGFGASQGTSTVSFTNASTGPTWTDLVPSQYRLWTDTLIIVEIPSRAGTGAVKVVTNQGTGIIGGPTIIYALLNTYNFSKVLYPFHKDNNGNGGFTWTMSNGFNGNNGAKNAFIRAMTTWRENTCINWENGPFSSTNQDSKDGVNNVRFANVGELETGVLGITRNYWTDCQGNVSYPAEIDLSYDPSTNWNTSTSPPSFNQMDMESVIVHELGHAHQLGHVINTGDFMHATIGPGQNKRKLINNNIDAGLYVMKKSVVAAACGPDPMSAVSGCSVPVGIDKTPLSSTLNVYPNPFSTTLSLNNNNSNAVIVGLYSSMGEKIENLTLLPGINSWQVPSDLSEGLYMLRNEATGEYITRLILKR